ncbi:unnamed protein product, partial [Nesidiocoris tenuis]
HQSRQRAVHQQFENNDVRHVTVLLRRPVRRRRPSVTVSCAVAVPSAIAVAVSRSKTVSAVGGAVGRGWPPCTSVAALRRSVRAGGPASGS